MAVSPISHLTAIPAQNLHLQNQENKSRNKMNKSWIDSFLPIFFAFGDSFVTDFIFYFLISPQIAALRVYEAALEAKYFALATDLSDAFDPRHRYVQGGNIFEKQGLVNPQYPPIHNHFI